MHMDSSVRIARGEECVFWRQTVAAGRRGSRGRGLKRMKFQIPLTVLDSWPGMHTSSGLGRAWGTWNSYLRYMCYTEKKCAVCLHFCKSLVGCIKGVNKYD